MSVAAVFVSSHAVAEDSTPCPSRIPVEQHLVGNAPDGWSNFDAKDAYPLVNVTFWRGPPDQRALLAPSGERRNDTGPVAIWTFAKSDIDDWVACEYAGTGVLLARPLDKTVERCTVQYDKHFSSPVAQRWHCESAQ
jgi:hypothetical protein